MAVVVITSTESQDESDPSRPKKPSHNQAGGILKVAPLHAPGAYASTPLQKFAAQSLMICMSKNGGCSGVTPNARHVGSQPTMRPSASNTIAVVTRPSATT